MTEHANSITLTNSSKILIAVLAFLAFCAGYWFLFLDPTLDAIDEKKRKVEELDLDVRVLQATLERRPRVEEQLEALIQAEEDLYTLLPSISELPVIFSNLENMIYDASVGIETFSTYEMYEQNWYQIVPFTIEVRGSDRNLIRLLERIEQFLHMALTSNVSLYWLESENTHVLSVQFVLIVLPDDRPADL